MTTDDVTTDDVVPDDVTPGRRARIDLPALAGPWSAMLALHAAVDDGPLEASLLHLVRIRASQINGCAYCLDMHVTEARRAGESQRRLDVLAGWREASVFDGRERAALAVTDAVTRLADGVVPDEVLDEAEAHLDPDELATLVYAVAEINAWNRLVVTARTPLPDVVG